MVAVAAIKKIAFVNWDRIEGQFPPQIAKVKNLSGYWKKHLSG